LVRGAVQLDQRDVHFGERIEAAPAQRPGALPVDERHRRWTVDRVQVDAVKYGWTFPSDSAAYWDWDDTTDSCQKLDFSVGVAYPKKLSAGVTYYF
jgi:hypothetical protein